MKIILLHRESFNRNSRTSMFKTHEFGKRSGCKGYGTASAVVIHSRIQSLSNKGFESVYSAESPRPERVKYVFSRGFRYVRLGRSNMSVDKFDPEIFDRLRELGSKTEKLIRG